MPASVLSRRKEAEHMGKAEIRMVKAEILMVKEEIITKENAVKAMVKDVAKVVAKDVVKAVAKDAVKAVVKAVAENSIMEEDIMKKDRDSTVAHPIAIGTMC